MLQLNDITGKWFTSDWHFNHYRINKQGEPRGVTLFERTQFKTIEEHDKYLLQQMRQWAKKHQGCTLWNLGDFGDISYLWFIEELRYDYGVECKFLYGNHDKISDLHSFTEAFNNVYLYPVYIHPRIIICHEPIWPVPNGTVIVHGHLHCMVIDNPHYLNTNIHFCNYKPLSSKRVMKIFNKIEKVSYKFLEEPYARHIKITQYKEDAIYDRKTGKMDYEESVRLYNKNHPDHPKIPIPKQTLSW